MKTVATRRWGSVRIADGSEAPSENVEAIAEAAKKKSDAEVPSQVCSQGDEEAIAKAAREKANKMTPQPGATKAASIGPEQVVMVLRQMASSLESSKNPDQSLLVADVKKFLQAIGG